MRNCNNCIYEAKDGWCMTHDCDQCPLLDDYGCRCVYIQRMMDDCPYYTPCKVQTSEVQDD